MKGLTTHVLDLMLGQPARGLLVRLAALDGGGWKSLGGVLTDDDGRAPDLAAGVALLRRMYKLTFETGAYFAASRRPTFYPRVDVVFEVTEPAQHHHVPLLLSPFGYSTYRGS
jgi:5-hydroxyisourate hydrolase